MRKFLVLLCLTVAFPLLAQEGGLDWDFGDIFYTPPEPPPQDTEPFSPMALLHPPGFSLHGMFEFSAGAAPGWHSRPWEPPANLGNGEDDFYWGPMVRMQSRFDLDAQISDILRIRTSIFFTFPGAGNGFALENFFELREFFFDYTVAYRLFFRGGRFNYNWGISPNFAFTNLIARIPRPLGDELRYVHDPFLLRLDVPVGIGGFQFVALTRRALTAGHPFRYYDVGYGARFNLALPRFDSSVAAFFQEGMPLRSALTFRTTLGHTEFYSEVLAAIDPRDPTDFGGAFNIGFIREFFRNRLVVNGELFFNTERNAFWFRPETSIQHADALPFPDGLNFALNLLYRFGGRMQPRLFLQILYAPQQNSAQMVPGFRLNLWEHLELYVAVPMALGERSGHYFSVTADPHPHYNRPFSVVILFTLSGTVRIGQGH